MNSVVDYDASDSDSAEMDDDLIGPPVPEALKLSAANHSMNAGTIHATITQHGAGLPVSEKFCRNCEDEESSAATDNRENDAAKKDAIGRPVPDEFVADDMKEGAAEEDEEAIIGPPVPAEFARPPSQTKNLDESDEDDELVGPPVPPEFAQPVRPVRTIATKDGQVSSDDSDDNDEEDVWKLPTSRHVDFKHGTKAVTALAVDPTGTRFATGSVDYEIRFWDFIGMNSSLQSFRSLYPCGNYPIKGLAYSSTGDAVLIVSGMAQAKVLDRDGHEKLECVKGDQYISDMARTKGHTAPLTAGCWHPRIREQFLTSSEDSTLRLWTVNAPDQHWQVIKCRSRNGLKTTPTACAFNHDGNLIACVCQDGSFQLWDTRKMFVSPCKMVRDAHQNGTDTSCVTFSYACNHLCTRGGDDTLKLWDVRRFSKPVHCAENLYSRYASTDCAFGPRDDVVVTGVSMDKGEANGRLVFFDVNGLRRIDELAVVESHVIKAQWHPRLQQIFVGCGNGVVRVYYGEGSAKGATLCANKRPVKAKQVETAAIQQIITPHALPMFRQDRHKSIRKQMEKDRLDPVKSRRPDLPIKSGQGGRVAATGSTLSSYVIRNLGLSKRVEDDQDPREAILKYAKEAAENPYWVSPAYSKTQPKPIFNSDESDEPVSKKKKS